MTVTVPLLSTMGDPAGALAVPLSIESRKDEIGTEYADGGIYTLRGVRLVAGDR